MGLNAIVDNDFVEFWHWVLEIGSLNGSTSFGVVSYLKRMKLTVYKKVNFATYVAIDDDNIYSDSLNKLSSLIDAETGNFKLNAFKNQKEFIFISRMEIALLHKKTMRFDGVRLDINEFKFNDLSRYRIEATPDTCKDSKGNELTQRITELEKSNKQLSNQIAKDKQVGKDQQVTIERLTAELNQAKNRIAELGNRPAIEHEPLLSVLLDKTHENHAPDLCHAINLWLDIYHHKPNNDSHSNKANTWVKNNTNYDPHEQGYSQTEKRIREITTPLKDFSNQRQKEKP